MLQQALVTHWLSVLVILTLGWLTGGGSYIIYRENGAIISYPGNTTVAIRGSYTSGDVLGIAVDSTNVKFYKKWNIAGYIYAVSLEHFVCDRHSRIQEVLS